MELLKPVVKGSADTLLRKDRADALLEAVRQLTNTRVQVGGDGGSRLDLMGEHSVLTISTPDMLRALPTGASVRVTISPNPPVQGTGQTGDIWIQYGTSAISTSAAVFFKLDGTLVLNTIFGYFSPAVACTLEDAQIYCQRGPTGADLQITLVDGSGVSLGVILAVPAGSKGVALQPSLAIAAGAIVQAKITQVGSTEPGAWLGLTLSFGT